MVVRDLRFILVARPPLRNASAQTSSGCLDSNDKGGPRLGRKGINNPTKSYKKLLSFCNVGPASQVFIAASIIKDCPIQEIAIKVGVAKEIKTHEYRVGLTPGAVREYVAAGHSVLIEVNAGAGIGATDDGYRKTGATVLDSPHEVFASSDMIVKVKEPQRFEWAQLRENQILFTYLHLAPDPEQAKGLLRSGCTAIAYETVTDMHGGLPLLAPMSEVAGRLAIEAAATALKRYTGGPGLLIGGVPGVEPARIVVIGGGVVGTHAARMAAGLCAEVTIIDRSIPRLRELDELFEGRVRTRFSTMDAVEEEVFSSDVVIGAVLVPGASAPRLVNRRMLSSMRKGSVIVDVAIDQGGCFETSRPTTHADPTYEVDGVIHYCRGKYARSCSAHLKPGTQQRHDALRFGSRQQGIPSGARKPHLRAGLNVHRGKLTYQAVAESLGLPFSPIDQAPA